MSIFKIEKRDHPFVIIDKRPLEDEKLSWKAKGLLSYLLSKPSDWTVRMVQLEAVSSDGRDSLYSAVKELESSGYVVKTANRDLLGKIVKWDYQVFEEPKVATSGLPTSGFPTSGKPATTNIDSTKNDTTIVVQPEAVKETPRMPSPLIHSLRSTLAELEGMNFAEMRGSDFSRLGGAIKSIYAASPGVTVEEVKTRAANYKKAYPGIRFTANGLAKHWPLMGGLQQVKFSPSSSIPKY